MIAVVGYASVDRTLRVDRLPAPGVTARVLSVAADGPLRPGGIGHTATALAAAVDDDVVPICAVGDDDAGRLRRRARRGRVPGRWRAHVTGPQPDGRAAARPRRRDGMRVRPRRRLDRPHGEINAS